MDKRRVDEFGEIFQDDLTDNQSEPDGPARDAAESDLALDSDVDSQEDDRAMAEDRFGVDEKKPG